MASWRHLWSSLSSENTMMSIFSKNKRLWCTDQRSFLSLLSFQNPLADSRVSKPLPEQPPATEQDTSSAPRSPVPTAQLTSIHVFWVGSQPPKQPTPGQTAASAHWGWSRCVCVAQGGEIPPHSYDSEPNWQGDSVSSFLSGQHLKCFSCQGRVQRADMDERAHECLSWHTIQKTNPKLSSGQLQMSALYTFTPLCCPLFSRESWSIASFAIPQLHVQILQVSLCQMSLNARLVATGSTFCTHLEPLQRYAFMFFLSKILFIDIYFYVWDGLHAWVQVHLAS